MEVMKTYWMLLLGFFSLLIANESRHSAEYVLENPGQFGGFKFVESYHMYVNLDAMFTVIGIGLLLGGVAKSLLLRQAKESSGLLRVSK
jgi:hypothetical protein